MDKIFTKEYIKHIYMYLQTIYNYLHREEEKRSSYRIFIIKIISNKYKIELVKWYDSSVDSLLKSI